MKMITAIMFDVEKDDSGRYYELRINPDLTLDENTERALPYFREFAQAIRVGYKELPNSQPVSDFARYYAKNYDGQSALPSSHRQIGIVLFSNSHNQQGREGARKLLLEENFELD